MTKPLTFTIAIVLLLTPDLFAQVKQQRTNPNINASSEYPGVFHSPSADRTPKVFRSVIQLEIVVNRGDNGGEVIYADGTVVSADGHIATALDEPGENDDPSGGIESATLLMLDGSSAAAEVESYDPAYGVAILKVADVGLPRLTLSNRNLVAKQRVTWHAVYRDGRKTWLYTRPLQIHTAAHSVGDTSDLCQVIDHGTSALSAERSGSAILALDGSLVAIMARQKHWNVTPKNQLPRRKLAVAIPASVIARMLEQVNGN